MAVDRLDKFDKIFVFERKKRITRFFEVLVEVLIEALIEYYYSGSIRPRTSIYFVRKTFKTGKESDKRFFISLLYR